MKFAVAVSLSAFIAASGLKLAVVDPDPAKIQLDADHAMEDSFGGTKLTPACDKIQCGEYSCPTPFELKVDNTCCGYCWAPDHVVPADRHAVVQYNATGNAIAQCDSAPSTCKGPGATAVRCFKPSCRVGSEPHCAPNACCPACAAV
eukprot:TRINITY_DN2174_c0_g2_i1.p1 TRINITY_DN2174_c0_g2~~TRINITY_DN2174_c0_g2_i1.p1  ORF type:complete len:147 (+),score=32.15 TRINITY_DN2174_c0_g2_i1:65-505(+)